MTGILISLPFLAVAAAVWLAGLAIDRRRFPHDGARRRRRMLAVLLGALVLCVLTAVFDSLMVAAALTHYHEGAVTGLRIWLAPVEDFLYPIAGVLLLPTLLDLLRRRTPTGAAAAAAPADAEEARR